METIRHLYVSLSGENRISLYGMDRDSGRLSHREDFRFHAGPGPMTMHPSKPVLYAALRSECEVISLRIEPSTGHLSQIGTVIMKEGPTMISTDHQGGYLLGAHPFIGAVSVNPIDAEGVVTDPQIQWLATTERAHYVDVDASNRFVFVPHVLPGNAIYQFSFDEKTGRLRPNEPHFEPPEGEGPRHFCLHPNGKLLYTSNEDSASVTAYHLDIDTGRLGPFQTVGTVPPEGYVPGEEAATCAQIRLTPDGRYLYAPTRGHDTIACFRLDESGRLATVGYAPTERHTRGTAMDPGGRFFYATGLLSGKLASFSISQRTGALEPLENFAIGDSPMWVEIVNPERL